MIFRAFVNIEIMPWIVLGSVLNVCFMITIIPFSRLMTSADRADENREIKHEIDEFRVQATEIIKDLDSIRLN
ncbi:MAG: hypothetical protein GTN99_02125 [Candidatus Dadabacteria bacterium]|nr:hypothetical protein [Candidatus Dadabacteria bacterium]